MHNVVRFYKLLCHEKAKKFKEHEVLVRQQLHAVAEALQRDPTEAALQDQHGSLLHQVKEVEEMAVKGKRVRSKIRWMLKGDSVMKEFFKAVQEKLESATIASLRSPDGEEIYDRRGQQTLCRDFYSNLYSAGPISDEEREAREIILRQVPASFTPLMGEQVSLPITATELHSTLTDMAKERSPGPDGISVEFFLVMWDVLGEEVTHMINSAIQEGRLPLGMTKGMLILIHKSGDRESLNNWRPISLLNVSYKIYAKTLQKRLQLLLTNLISEDQSAFLPNRYILDNILTQHEIIQWVKESHQEMVLLKLDFRKAYDTVAWDFLFEAMRRMGMPNSFV
jgi:hypothetical protein